MTRYLLLPLCMLALNAMTVDAQSRYFTDQGNVTFFSDAPLEDITASSNELRAILDTKTGKIIAKLRIRSFDFKKELMEEHFNENYLESDQYPEAVFRGQLKGLSGKDIKEEQPLTFPVKGDITIHGVIRSIEDSVQIVFDGDIIQGKATFNLKPKSFDIKIPTIVIKKIAEVVEVNVDMMLEPIKE